MKSFHWVAGFILLNLSFFVSANQAPDCSHAVASPTTIWPANHQFQSISISQVTDADHDPTTIKVQCISQDEPLNSTGDGNFTPDGDGIGTSQALVRAERKGNSNGRFYHINFTATDTQGASCTGVVTVSVSHDKEKAPIDEGKLYSSTLSTTQCATQPQNRPPIISSAAVTQVNENELYAYDVNATDPDGNILTYSFASIAPQGMTINSQTGLINWQTNFNSAGVYAVVVRVQDSYGATAEQSFQLTVNNVNHPPQITSMAETVSVVNQVYQYAVTATDADQDALVYELTTSPTGMTINSTTGQIAWTPSSNQLGTYTTTVRVTDVNGASAEQTFTIFVSNGYADNNQPPQITSSPITSANQGQPYSYTVTAQDPDNDAVAYALNSAPTGMQIDATTGVIAWTPTNQQSGTQRIVVIATDARGATDTQTYYINVTGAQNQPPQFISTPVTDAIPESIYIYSAVATDPEQEVITYSLANPPAGMSINANTGVIVWIPADNFANQTVTVDVVAKDEQGAQAIQSYQILVAGVPTNHAPHFISTPITETMSDVLYTYLSEATDSDSNDVLSYALTTSPTGAIVNTVNGDMAWTPDSRYVISSTGDNKNCRVQDAQQQFSLASDLIVTHIALTSTVVSATLKNRGVAVVNGNVTVSFYEDDGNDQDNSEGRLLGAVTLNALAIGAEQQLSINTDTALIKADVIAVITTDAAVKECYLTNNKTRTALFDLNVSDVASTSDRQRYLVNVFARNHTPYFAPATDSATSYTGSAFTYLANATDTDLNDGLIYKLVGTIPTGVTIDQYTGVITWTPTSTQTGNNIIQVEVTDSANEKATLTLTVNVLSNAPPEIITTPVPTVNENAAYQYDANVFDPDVNEVHTWSLQAPSQFSINKNTGLISGNGLSKYILSVDGVDNSCLQSPIISNGLNPVVKWQWNGVTNNSTYQHVFGPITVGQLSDDNGDGKINNADTPDAVFTAGPQNNSSTNNFLTVVSGDTGKELWATNVGTPSIASPVALGDIDNDGILELITTNNTRTQLLAYEHTGQLKWSVPSGPSTVGFLGTTSLNGNDGISIADIDHDGSAEIIVNSRVYNADGTLRWVGAGDLGGINIGGSASIPVDVDLSGDMELSAGRTLYNSDGSVRWTYSGAPADGMTGVGNFDDDSNPEIVLVSSGKVYLLEHDGTAKIGWGPVVLASQPNQIVGAGGPPTIGDFNGDGRPDIGVAGATAYTAIDTDGHILWSTPTQDTSSGVTGSSLFDFEGDGRVEVLYADEFFFRIYDGLTGTVLYFRENSSTTRIEYPVVADIDNDGQAEILIGSNKIKADSQKTSGVVALEAGAGTTWAPTRNMWNQHAYHVTNINDDGTIPQNEQHSWLTHNTYRLNSFLNGPAFGLADLRIGYAQVEQTGSNYTVKVDVKNRGLKTSEITTLNVYQGESAQGRLLGTVTVPALISGETKTLSLTNIAGLESGNSNVYAVVDSANTVTECHSDNNASLTPILNETVTDHGGLSDSQLFTIAVNNINQAPTITSIAPGSITAGQTWQYTLDINDPDIGDGFRYTLVKVGTQALPKGMVTYPNGLVRWRTISTDAGTYTFKVRVTDVGGLFAEQTITLTVRPDPNNPPVITTQPGNTTIKIGSTFTYDVNATDANNDALTYSIVGWPLPSGMNINATTGLIQWAPTAQQVGSYELAVRVTDTKGATAIQYFTVTVPANNAPIINSQPSTTTTPSATYAYAVLATDADSNPLTYSLTTKPTGMTISNAGVITWAVPQNAPSSVNVVVSVSDGLVATTQSWTINIATTPIINHAPVINSTPIYGAQENSQYTYQATATDADGDVLTWLLVSAPTGMTINATTGYVQWSVDVPGSYLASIKVVDSKGASTTQSWFINVFDNNAPRFVTSPVISIYAGETYVYDANAIDPNDDPITYTLVHSAPRMTMNVETGLIEWASTEDEAGVYTIELMVTDDNGLSSTQLFNLEVLPPINLPPVISSTPSTVAAVGFAYSYQVTATDPENKPLTFSLLSAPSGVTINSTGLTNWTPSSVQTGAQLIIVGVSDGVNTTQQPITLTVSAAPAPLGVSVGLTPGNVLLGQATLIDADVVGGLKPYTVTLSVDGVQQSIDSNYRVNYTANSAGVHLVTVNVVDALNQATTFNANFTVYGQGDTSLPIVNIDNPLEDTAKVSAPTPINISVNDATLAQWRLTVRKPGEADEGQLLAAGTTTVNNQQVADFDPTLRLNGMYELVLQAWDVSGNYAIAGKRVIVDGNMKVGNFAFTVEDVNIPMLGIPVSVRRTYDNRQRHDDLDFGYGWSVDYQNVRIDESREPSQGWYLSTERHNFIINSSSVSINATCVRSTGNKKVTVTLPNGEVEKFKVRAVNNSGGISSIDDPDCYMVASTYLSLEFKSEDNTFSTLTSSDGQGLTLAGGNLTNDITDPSPTAITNYRLTTREGMIFDLAQGVGIKTVTDTNANTLTYSSTGITHSAGQSLKFVRDSLGRITSITNPANGNAVIARYAYNTAGDLTSAYDQLGARTQYTYNTDHSLLEIKDPLNRKLINNIYDDKGRLIAQVDSDGNRTDFNHDLDGRREVVKDRNGNVTEVFYDERGNVINQVDALGGITTRTYDANDNEIGKMDALGRATLATFNTKNDQLTETDALNNTTTFTYNAKGQELTIQDKLGRTYTNTYDAAGNLLSIKDPANNTMQTTIGSGGTVNQLKDALNNTTQFTYDSKGNKKTETNALGQITTFTYDVNNNVKTENKTRTKADGSQVTETTQYEYDAKDRVIKTTQADGSVTRTEYDAAGNQVATIDAKGKRTEMQYDVYKRLIKTIYPDTTFETKEYDKEGNVIAETDRAGKTTTHEYDALNRNIKTIYADNSFTQTEYDAVGNVKAEIDAKGNRTTHEYDALNRKTATVNALSQRHSFEYDNEGRLTKETDANLHITQYQYNTLGQKIKTIYQDNSNKQDGVDALGRKTSQTDEAGVVTQYQYDALGRLIKVTDAQNNITQYAYDEAGNKISQTDAEGRVTRWDYDSLGRVVKRTLPLGQFETFTYDANGNELTHVDFKGQTTTSTYDVTNRLVSKAYADGASESYTYTTNGQVETVTQTTGSTTNVTRYEYDNLDRLKKETKPNGDRNEYIYDSAGNKTQTKTTLANGSVQTVTNTYDELNRLKTTVDSNGTTVYTYDNVGNQQSVTYTNGKSQNYIYDVKNRLTEMDTKQGTALTEQYIYTLEPTGRRKKLVELSGRTTDWGYDNLYRLTSEVIADAVNGNTNTSFTYDKVGNRKTETTNSVTTTYAVDNNDRLTQQGNTTYAYDNNGNTLTESTGSNTKTFSYNAQNELVSATQNSVNATFTYDADGIRTSRTVNSVTTNFVTDKNRDYAQVVAEVEGGATKATYTYGADLISQNRSGTSSYYLYDALGSVKALSDSTGAVTDTYNYTAFGKDLNHTGTTANSYKYAGEQYDSALDNYYLRARYYNQNVGRFTQMDTYAGNGMDPVTLHKYLYANVNPVNMRDPSGRMSLMELGTSISVLGTLTTISNAGITFLGAQNAKQDADGIPDAVIFTFGGSAGSGGAMAEAGGDVIYDLKTGKAWAYGSFGVGLSPISLFNNFKSAGLTKSVGVVWNFKNPNEWSGFALNANWPMNILPLLPAAAFSGNKMWGAMTQLAKRERNIRRTDLTVQIGVSTGGPVAAKVAWRSNSFSTGVGWATQPLEISSGGFSSIAQSLKNDLGKSFDEF